MVARLLAWPDPPLRTTGLVVFLLGTARVVVKLARRRVRAAHLRLLVALLVIGPVGVLTVSVGCMLLAAL